MTRKAYGDTSTRCALTPASGLGPSGALNGRRLRRRGGERGYPRRSRKRQRIIGTTGGETRETEDHHPRGRRAERDPYAPAASLIRHHGGGGRPSRAGRSCPSLPPRQGSPTPASGSTPRHRGTKKPTFPLDIVDLRSLIARLAPQQAARPRPACPSAPRRSTGNRACRPRPLPRRPRCASPQACSWGAAWQPRKLDR